MKQTSDDQIMAWLLTPNTRERGFKALVDTYQKRLYHHIRRMINRHEDTDDVLQNVFIKVYRNIDKFKGQSKLYTWLYRIATNECLDFIATRKRKISAVSLDNEELSWSAQPKADLYFDADEAQRLLLSALESLPEKQRIVFNMRYYDEMPYKDMSEVLNTSVGALKASYHHAVKKVEIYLKSTV